MQSSSFFLTAMLFLGLVACTAKENKAPVPVVTPKPSVSAQKPSTPKDAVASHLAKLFAQADGVHREAWWVLSETRNPISKSPFGKVERSFLTAQNLKLPNKSLFRCDRYTMKRDVKGVSGYPQMAEIYEKCSEKTAAKKIAYVTAHNEQNVSVTFYPDNLEEVLGVGPAILNRIMECTLKSQDGHLTELNCKNWAQDRSKEHMIRLDEYHYVKAGRNLIKLRGKVFENLTETRKIVADIPMEGKIMVVETELYAPAPSPSPTPTAVTTKGPNGEEITTVGKGPVQLPAHQIPQPVSPPTGVGPMGAPESAQNAKQNPPGIDPDVIRQRDAFERGETDELPYVEGMMAAPDPQAGEAAAAAAAQRQQEQQQQAEEAGEQDPSQQQEVPPPREEVIQRNDNEGEYHAR